MLQWPKYANSLQDLSHWLNHFLYWPVCVGQLVCLLNSYTSLFANEFSLWKLCMISLLWYWNWGSLMIVERIPRKRQALTFFDFFFLASSAAFFRSNMLSSRILLSSSSGSRFKTIKVKEWFVHKKVVALLSVFTRVLMKLLVDSKETVAFDYWKPLTPPLPRHMHVYVLKEKVF